MQKLKDKTEFKFKLYLIKVLTKLPNDSVLREIKGIF